MNQIKWSSIEVCLNQKDADWKKREESLQTVVNQLDKRDKYAMEIVMRNTKGIALQLNDLRSTLVKLAASIIEKFASYADEISFDGIDKFTELLLKDSNFINALGCANKVINNYATSAFRALCQYNQISLTILENFYIANKDSKNINIRERIAEGLSIYAANLNNNSTTQLRSEGTDFLRKGIDIFIKDASGPVRGYAKNAKESLDSYLSIIGKRPLDKTDTKEQLKLTKTVSRSIDVKKPRDNNTNLEEKKTIPVPKKTKPKGMEIENDDTIPNGTVSFNNNTQTKKIISKINVILDIIEDPKKQIKDKIDELNRCDFNNINSTCTIEDYKRLLNQMQQSKNTQLDKVFSSLIDNISISKFIGKLLSYTENERLDKKESYALFMDRLLNEDISSFIDYFLLRNNIFSLKLLLQRFDIDEFESFIDHKPDIVPSLLTIICQNMLDNHPDSFIRTNASMLEHMYQSGTVISGYKCYPFNEAFLEKLRQFNPGLFKFLLNNKRKQGDKNVPTPIKEKEQHALNTKKTVEIPLKVVNQIITEEPDTQSMAQIVPRKNFGANHSHKKEGLEQFIEKMESAVQTQTVESKKDAISDLLRYFKGCSSTNDTNTPDVVFAKVISLLKESFNNNYVDDELISLTYRLSEELYRISNKNTSVSKGLVALLVDIFSQHQNAKEKLVAQILDGSLRLSIYTYLISLTRSNDIPRVVDSLKMLTLMARYSKKTHSYLIFHKEMTSGLDGLKKIAKELFLHTEVSVRKNVVHFLVECYFFMDHSVYPKLMEEFTPEQQKLVEIYIKKIES